MENSKLQTGMGKAADKLSAALFDLRDALVELSLTLKDLQFETDLEQRKAAEETARQLLEKIASVRGLDSS